MNDFLKNLRELWNKLEAVRRRQLVIAGGAVLLFVVAMSYWLLRTDYQVLFSGLESRDAATIVGELKRMKVDYRLDQDGSRILVDGRRVHDVRLNLMSRNLSLSGGVGFEIFDNKDVGLTESTQKINYLRALQGELARTIMAVNEIKYARVHLVVAETGLFRRTKMEPKASVTVVLKPGASLRTEQVIGIQRLVAAAVPGLETRHVTISDQRGITLSSTQDDEGLQGVGNAKLLIKKQVEDQLLRKVTDVLDRSLGPGKVVVGINVTLNFDEIRRTQENLIPANRGKDGTSGAILRQRVTVRKDMRYAPETVAAAGNGRNAAVSGPQHTTTDTEFIFGKTVEHVVASPGGIERLSISVVVPAGQDEDQVARIREIVSAAAGLNPARGDTISIQPIDRLMKTPTAKPVVTGTVAGRDGPQPPASLTASLNRWWQGALRSLKQEHPAVIAGAVFLAIAAIVFLAGLIRRAARRMRTKGGLNDAEREQLLADIRGWLSRSKNPGGENNVA